MTRGFSIKRINRGHLHTFAQGTQPKKTKPPGSSLAALFLKGRVMLPFLFLLGELVLRKTRLFVVYHFYFEGKLVSYRLCMCLQDFSLVIVLAFRDSRSCHRLANPKRMTLSRRPTSKKFRTSRAKKVTCLRCGAGNDQER